MSNFGIYAPSLFSRCGGDWRPASCLSSLVNDLDHPLALAGRRGQEARNDPSAVTGMARFAGPYRLSPGAGRHGAARGGDSCRRSEEHTSELQSLMRISYAVFCLKKKKQTTLE